MRPILLFLFIVAYQSGYSQNRLIDSLQNALERHPHHDTIRASILNELSLRIFKKVPDQSFDYAQDALTLSNRLLFQKGISMAKNNLAVYQLMKGNADDALELALEAEKIGEKYHLNESLAHSYAILGTIYDNEQAYDKGLRYLALAQKTNSKIKNTIIESKILNALGAIANTNKKFDSALFFYGKALEVMRVGKDEYRLPEVLNNMAVVYTRQHKNELALEYYYKALAAGKRNDNRRAQAMALSNIGLTHLAEKKFDKAESEFLESLALSKAIGDRKTLSSDYMFLGQLKNETGKFDEAHIYTSNFYELKDSLLNLERVKKIAELEVKYESEKKEHVIQLLERDKKIQLLWTNILIGVLTALIILSAGIYYFQRFREQKNLLILNLEIDQLTTKHRELSEKYKNILSGGNVGSIESVDQRLLKKAVEVIENNMGDPLFGVEQMAKELGMSRTNLHRKIKAITGFPPSELIRNVRLRTAATLLLKQADTVSQISFTVGFEDQSYFSKSFKKQFGVSPSEYFQSMRQMN